MEAVKLLSEVLDRYQTAMAFHWESQNLFYWLSLKGFSAIHEYQFYDETRSAQKLKEYIIDRYGVVVLDKGPDNPEILTMIDQGQDRIDVDPEQKWKLIQGAWEKYRLWELSTRKEYQRIATDLLNAGKVDDFQYISKLIEDVSLEIVKIEEIILDMSGTNYDLPHISDLQPSLEDQYNHKIKHIFKAPK